jgi:hypothetical protein
MMPLAFHVDNYECQKRFGYLSVLDVLFYFEILKMKVNIFEIIYLTFNSIRILHSSYSFLCFCFIKKILLLDVFHLFGFCKTKEKNLINQYLMLKKSLCVILFQMASTIIYYTEKKLQGGHKKNECFFYNSNERTEFFNQ